MARGLNALGCVPLAPPPIRPIIGTPILSFLAGGTHICRPRAHLAARATDTRMGPPNGPPSGKGFRIAKKAQKKARLGVVNEPQIGVWKFSGIYDTGKQSEETSPISRPGCRSWRESPRRVWRLGARTSEERPEERRDEQQVRDVSDDSHRPSVEPVALGESPGGVPRGRRRRAPSPRSGRCTRTHHRGRLRAPRRRFDRRSHPASRGAPPTRGDAMLVVAVPFESHRFRVLRARARKCRVCYDMSFSNSVISSRKAARGPGSI